MSKSSGQKLKILYLLKFFKEHTDEEHGATMSEILKFLDSNGISAERKSVYADIEALNIFGADIAFDGRRYSLVSREFELAELKLLADCVGAAKFITEKKSGELIKKIESLASTSKAAEIRRQVYISDRVKAKNEKIYYVVDKLHTAISEGKKISFLYYEYDLTKQRKAKNNGKPYVVSPYSLTVSDENYYLIAHYPKYEKLTHFRVDRMDSVEITDEMRTDIKSVAGEKFSLGEYSRSTFNMFKGELETVKLRCDNSLITAVLDRFGTDITVIPYDDGTFTANVTVNVSPTFYSWVFTFGGMIKIEAPNSAVEKFNEILRKF